MLRVGYVVETHPEDHSVDLVMADDGARVIGAQVVAPDASARSGTAGMPKVTPKSKDKWDITQAPDDAMKAMVGFVHGRQPVVVGFLFPQINQMLPKKGSTARRYRHPSDLETLIDDGGNLQVTHPSGTYIRIGETIDHAAPEVADKTATDRNTARKVNIHIGMADGALELTLSPTGAVSLRCNQGVTVDAGQKVHVKAPSVTLETPIVTATQNVTIQGNLTVQGSTAVEAIASRGHDISSTHVHRDTMSGPGTSGVPV